MVTGFFGVSSLGSVVRGLGCCRGGFFRVRSVFALPGRCGVVAGCRWISRCSKIALANSMRVRHRRRSRSSTCIRARNDSINALSEQSPTDPIEGTRPDWRARSPNAQEMKGVPWSEWITVSGSGWRLPIAIPRAEVTSTGVADWLMDQPTTRRLKGVEDHCAVDLAFSGWMLGRIRHPQLVRFVADEAAVYQVRWGIQGSDPTPSGASALLRPCRPVLRMSIPRRVVPDPDSIRQRQLRVHPRCFIRRRDCWWIWWMRSASHTWRIARAEGGRFLHS